VSQEHDAPFVPPPPPSPVEGNSLYPPHVLEQKRKEIEADSRNALIFSLIGLVCCGLIWGVIALPKANNAIELINIYEVAKDRRGIAVAAKVIAIIDIIGWIIIVATRLIMLMAR
jgi:hypothetical protein